MQQERASKKQQELFQFVKGFIEGNGYGPSYREIMRALEYKSVSTVAIHIDGLITKGYLARRDKSARSLEIVTASKSGKNAEESPASLAHQLNERIAQQQLTGEETAQIYAAMKLIGINLTETNDET